MVLSITLKLIKCVIWEFCVSIVENMNVFSFANMCLLYAMSICKWKSLSDIHGTRGVWLATARRHASISVSPRQEQQYFRTYRQQHIETCHSNVVTHSNISKAYYSQH